ncbi:uncharacterized protein LOC135082788 [Ostrinia nubilalis]|uniref:uncharacterized protein LOC135082788 n=1 Tax=Ostrinia nubilalis TaxID=29057 RepID=UPI0030824AE9
MAEVDKFKRRVIRAVARHLRQDKTPGEAMWKALRNEAGCDCKLLWQRMRALTLKKMKRLVLAEDRLNNIAAVAQMTLTDWLLFDLVLVHEEIDVIGQDLKTEPGILMDLFNVVKRFQIEGKQGEALTTAWTAATFYYNSFGRQCSPMLLQRRWYQIKKNTRKNFYKFWFEYRGNARLVSAAKAFQPTPLQSAVAQRFPHIVTKPFMEWDQMIKEKYVILPEEFEAKIKKKYTKKSKPAANEPDIVLVEPQIETIEVESDPEGDKEDKNESNSNRNTPEPNTMAQFPTIAALLKKEPIDDFEIDVDDLNENAEETSHIDDETLEAVGVITDDVGDSTMTTDDDTNTMPMICSVAGNFSEDSVTNSSKETANEVMDEINSILTSAATKPNVKSEPKSPIPDETSPVVVISPDKPQSAKLVTETIEEDTDELMVIDESVKDNVEGNQSEVMTEIDNILESAIQGKVQSHKSIIDTPATHSKSMEVDETAKELIKECSAIDITADDVEQDTIEEIDDVDKVNSIDDCVKREINDESDEDDEVKLVDIKSVGKSPKSVEENMTVPLISSIHGGEKPTDDSMMDISTEVTFEDDGIELVDDGIAIEDDDDYGAESVEPEASEDNEPAKFDLKLLMHPCVYTIKLEDMYVFKNKDIHEVKDVLTIEAALIESKMHIKKESINDLKEELQEIIKEDLEDIIKEKPEIIIKEEPENMINEDPNEIIKQEPEEDTKHSSDENSSDEDEVPENRRVKLTSYMLQKPKSRSYNPIQLCKNPDFNTRLKRLTVGFLSSNRNRLLLKYLKPMTVDLSKAFESKLIDGTIYLKPDSDGPRIKREKEETSSQASSAVLPSAMPAQMLIDSTCTAALRDLLPPPSRNHPTPLPERQKTVTLPDINNIRRINQNLLTAEVTPMRIQAGDANKYDPPVHIVSPPKATPFAPENPKQIETRPENVTNAPEPDPETAAPEAVSGPSTAAPGEKTRKQHTKQPRAFVSWNVYKKPSKPCAEDEFLLTLDALSKMLHLFNENETVLKIKGHKPLSRQKMELMKRLYQYENNVEDETRESFDITEEDKAKEAAKEKEKKRKEKAMDVPPPLVVITPKINVVEGQEPYAPYCCWARNKIVTGGGKALRAHRCPRVCRCCCRDQLAQQFVERHKKPPTIDISDEDETPKLKKVSESIETVVQSAPRLTVKPAEELLPPPLVLSKKKPRRHIVHVPAAMDARTVSTSTVSTSTDLDSTVPAMAVSTPAVSGSVSLVPTADVSTSPVTTSVIDEPGVSPVIPDPVDPAPVVPATAIPTPVIQPPPSTIAPKKLNQSEVITINDSDDVTPPLPKIRPPNKRLYPYAGMSQLIRKDTFVYPTPYRPRVKHQGHITIDASRKELKIHSQTASYRDAPGMMEKILYLNSKKQAEGASPIFLGQNKILLTDIRFPRNDSVGTVQSMLPPVNTVPVTIPPTAEAPPPQLPAGVHIVLLPDGQLTYSVESGVELTEQDLVAIPIIIEAVRKQLNSTNNAGLNAAGQLDVINAAIAGVASSAGAASTTGQPDTPGVVADANSQEPVDLTDENTDDAPACSDVTTNPEASVPLETETQESAAVSSNTENKTDSTENDSENQNQIENKTDNDSAKIVNVINTSPENIQMTDISEAEKDNNNDASTENISEVPSNQTEQEKSLTETNDKITVPDNETTTPIEMSDDNKVDQGTGDSAGPAEPSDVLENSSEKPEATTSSNSNRKTLLSDLMEMSGISEEDIQTSVPVVNQVVQMQPEVMLTAPAEADVMMAAPAQPEALLPAPVDPDVVIDGPVPPPLTPNCAELSPIMSFSQLKYACERNGTFFKLDLKLGTLSRISVCLKKNPPRKQPLKILPKSVIDLTDDPEDVQEVPLESVDEDTLPKTVIRTNKSLLKDPKDRPTSGQPEAVTPLKLFRAIRILKKNKQESHLKPLISKPSSSNATNNVQTKQTRKQELNESSLRHESQSENNQETGQESVDDGLTSRELDESSLDSEELNQYIWKDSSGSESDSSDDEPLAKKAKRMRCDEDQEESNAGEKQMDQDQNPAIERPKEVEVSKDTNAQNEVEMEVVNDQMEDEKMVEERLEEDEEVPEDADIAGVEEVPIAGGMQSEMMERMDEDEDDDNCILGV